jgi:hypothetical protein
MSIKARVLKKVLKAGDSLIRRGENMFRRKNILKPSDIFSQNPKIIRKKVQDATGVKMVDPSRPRYIDPKVYKKFKEELRKR